MIKYWRKLSLFRKLAIIVIVIIILFVLYWIYLANAPIIVDDVAVYPVEYYVK